ncbi:MAG: NPCBM/NEW2 domain-containing protein [Rikenellaceae bacterium]
MKKLIIPLFMLVLGSPSLAQNKVSITSFDLSRGFTQYGAVTMDCFTTGEPLSAIDPSVTDRGFGLIAPSVHKFALNGGTSTFSSSIGVLGSSVDFAADDISSIPLTDGTRMLYRAVDNNKRFVGVAGLDGTVGSGSVVFRVVGDGRELYNSGLMTPQDGVQQISVNVGGVRVLELITDDGGDGSSGDYAAWIDPEFDYFEISPNIVSVDYMGEAPVVDAKIQKSLNAKIKKLPQGEMGAQLPSRDWMIDPSFATAGVFRSADGKNIIISNGLVARTFRILPNLATIDIINHQTGANMLRAVSPEGSVTINNKNYSLGGLMGQPEFGYLQYEWVDAMTTIPNSFTVKDFEVTPIESRIDWDKSRWALNKKAPTGKVLTFVLESPQEIDGVVVKLHYALYDGIPTISKWFEIDNGSGSQITLNKFKLEELAMVEGESPVDTPKEWELPNIHVEADWAFGAMQQSGSDVTQYWERDPRYTSQCNYPLETPCILEVRLPMGPDVDIAPDESFSSFRVWETLYDSYDKERAGMTLRRMYTTVAPWATQNPIFMHCVSSDPEVVRTAIDQCREVGYEMVILSFGSGLNMEDESPENYAKFRELNDYAESQGIQLGAYSLLSSRWISDEVDVINPETGKRGGMIFGSSPCLSSEWGHEYFRKIRRFFEETGMKAFENDGSYPGNVCASTSHAHHKGLEDSQWEQRKLIAELYKWMAEEGIYTNVPDFYIQSGSTKTGIGYREVNWSLPRQRQLVLGRQVIYDGLWTRTPSMCWTFVPLTQYHGGGAEATLEPLNDHLDDYKAHMMQNYGSGVQACYRGPRLYDTPQTRAVVKEVIDWYKNYREILNSDIIHLRRADGRDYDAIMHVNPSLDTRAMVMVYNPTSSDMTRTLTLPLYYSGIERSARVSVEQGEGVTYELDRQYNIEITVDIPANSYSWLVVESAD